jgi:hypothetical protein
MAPARRRQILIQSPRIAALLQLMHDIVSYAKAFFLTEALSQSANQFPRALKREGDSVAQGIAASSHPFTRRKLFASARARRGGAGLPLPFRGSAQASEMFAGAFISRHS